MTAPPTPAGMPEMPVPCRAFQHDSVRTVEDDYHTPYAMREYARQCYEAGHADGFEAGRAATIQTLKAMKMLGSAI